MQIGDLVLWKGLNGHGRAWKGIGVVIDYKYYPEQLNEALVLYNPKNWRQYEDRKHLQGLQERNSPPLSL